MSIDENTNKKGTGGAPVLWRSRPTPQLTSWCGLPRFGLGRFSSADDPRRTCGQFAQGLVSPHQWSESRKLIERLGIIFLKSEMISRAVFAHPQFGRLPLAIAIENLVHLLPHQRAVYAILVITY